MAREGKNTPIRIGFREIDTSLAGIPREVMKFFEGPVRAIGQLMPHAVRESDYRHPSCPALNPGASEPRPDLVREKLRADLAASFDRGGESAVRPNAAKCRGAHTRSPAPRE